MQVEARLEFANFNQESARNASSFDWKHFDDELVKRQFSHIADIGTDALTDLSKLKKVRSKIGTLAQITLPQERCGEFVARINILNENVFENITP